MIGRIETFLQMMYRYLYMMFYHILISIFFKNKRKYPSQADIQASIMVGILAVSPIFILGNCIFAYMGWCLLYDQKIWLGFIYLCVIVAFLKSFDYKEEYDDIRRYLDKVTHREKVKQATIVGIVSVTLLIT